MTLSLTGGGGLIRPVSECDGVVMTGDDDVVADSAISVQ